MKIKNALLAGFLAFNPFSPVLAEPGWFFGVGGGVVGFDRAGDTIQPANLVLRGGLALNEFVEVGVEASQTEADDKVGGVDYDVDSHFIFLRLNLDLGETLGMYAMVGPTSIELTGRTAGIPGSADDRGVGFGVGARFRRSGRSALFVDYLRYYDGDSFDGAPGSVLVEGLNAGFFSRF